MKKTTRMREFNVRITVEYEGYNGYEHQDTYECNVTALNEKSAEKKAKKSLNWKGGVKKVTVTKILNEKEKEVKAIHDMYDLRKEKEDRIKWYQAEIEKLQVEIKKLTTETVRAEGVFFKKAWAESDKLTKGIDFSNGGRTCA